MLLLGAMATPLSVLLPLKTKSCWPVGTVSWPPWMVPPTMSHVPLDQVKLLPALFRYR